MTENEDNRITAFLVACGQALASRIAAAELIAISAVGIADVAAAHDIETPLVWGRVPGQPPRRLTIEGAIVGWFGTTVSREIGAWRLGFTPRAGRHWPPMLTYKEAF